MDEAFGAQLRSIRQERGLSREQLAERMGWSNGKAVCKYETAEKDPQVRTVSRFAAALQVEAAELLEEPQR